MARLPQPNGDDNNWGDVLNDYIGQAYDSAGALKANVVGAAQLQNGAVTAPKLSATSPTNGQALTYSTSGLIWTTLPAGISTGTTGQYFRGDKSWQTLNKAAVGLANVDNTADTAKPVTTAETTALSGKASFVLVITGSEARPSGSFCIWAGGNVEPTNMAANDLWLAAAAPADTTPPTTPTSLASSGITSTSFTVSWAASTGAPIEYEVFVGGVSAGTTAVTTLGFTGKTPATAYSVTVRARDASNNWSGQSSALVVTTNP